MFGFIVDKLGSKIAKKAVTHYGDQMFAKETAEMVSSHAKIAAVVAAIPGFGFDFLFNLIYIIVLWDMYFKLKNRLGGSTGSLILTGIIVNLVFYFIVSLLDSTLGFIPLIGWLISATIVYLQFYFSAKAFIESMPEGNYKPKDSKPKYESKPKYVPKPKLQLLSGTSNIRPKGAASSHITVDKFTYKLYNENSLELFFNGSIKNNSDYASGNLKICCWASDVCYKGGNLNGQLLGEYSLGTFLNPGYQFDYSNGGKIYMQINQNLRNLNPKYVIFTINEEFEDANYIVSWLSLYGINFEFTNWRSFVTVYN